MSALLSLVLQPEILAVLGGIAATVFAFLKGRSSGAAKERAKQDRARHKARDINDEIEDAIAGRSNDGNREELGKWSKR